MTGSLLTASEVAKLLGVPVSWVYEQSRQGRIPTVTLGRYRRYRLDSIEAWVSELETTAAARAPRLRLARATDTTAAPPCSSLITFVPVPLGRFGTMGSWRGGHEVRALFRCAATPEALYSWYGQWWVGGRQVNASSAPSAHGPAARSDPLSSRARAAAAHRGGVAGQVRPGRHRRGGRRADPRPSRVAWSASARRSATTSPTCASTSPRSSATGRSSGSTRRRRGLLAAKRREGSAPKSVRNYLGLLHSIFALRREARAGRAATPCKLSTSPRRARRPRHPLPRRGELEALLRAVPDDVRRSDRARALPDRGDDRPAPGRAARRCAGATSTGPPAGCASAAATSAASSARPSHAARRAPCRWPTASPASSSATSSAVAFQADDDLVFCHPQTGAPLDRSKLLQALQGALAARRRPARSASTTCATPSAPGWPPPASPLRTIQEWMGHRDFKTTLIYADYAAVSREADLVERAFEARAPKRGTNLSETDKDLR